MGVFVLTIWIGFDLNIFVDTIELIHTPVLLQMFHRMSNVTFTGHNTSTKRKAQPWTPELFILCFLWDLSLLYRFTIHLIKERMNVQHEIESSNHCESLQWT